MANKVIIDNIDTIPIGPSPDLMNMIVGLAADIESLKRRVTKLESPIPLLPQGMVDIIVNLQERVDALEIELGKVIVNVPESEQGHNNTADESDSR